MTEQNFDVYLRFLMENKDAKAGTQELIDAYEALSKSVEELGPEFKRGSELWQQYMAPFENQVKEAIKGMQNLGKATQQTTKTIEEQSRQAQLQIRILNQQAADLRRNAELYSRFASRIEATSRGLAIGGTAVVGGIFAEASNYAKNAKIQTDATRAWTTETEKLGEARKRVDEILTRQTLPLLQLFSKYADKAADVIERNPKIIDFALGAGGVAIALGTLGGIIGKGLRMYADAKYFAAAGLQQTASEMQLVASQNQLRAAGLQAGASKGGAIASLMQRARGYGVTGGMIGPATAAAASGVTVATLGGAALVGAAASVWLTALGTIGARATAGLREKMGLSGVIPGVAKTVGTGLGKLSGLSEEEVERKATVFSALIGRIAGDLDKSSPLWLKAAEAVKKTSKVVEEAAETLSDKDIGIAKAFGDWRKDDAKIVQDAMNARRNIIADGERSIVALTQRYRNQVASINANANKQASSIMARYAQDSRKAEETYTRERAEIIQDAGEEIQKIEADRQEELRKLAQDHNDAMDDLLADRDALGLAKEQERYDRARSEAESEINKEIAERKRETAVRLADLAENFARERQERRSQYQQDMAENALQRAQALAEAAANHQAEIKQAREATLEKLRDLAQAAAQERSRRREMFLTQIRDIDATLLGERNTKNAYYMAMLRDAEVFMSAYRARLNLGSGTISATATGGAATSGGAATTAQTVAQSAWSALQSLWSNINQKDSGGYVNKGIYKVAWNGKPEFVMSNSATKAAEEMIGGQLTQDRLLAALSSREVNYTDQRRFNSGISARDRREIGNDTRTLLENLVRS